MTPNYSILLRLTLAFSAIVGFNSAHAATRTWTGGHATSAQWNLRDNWGGVAVPTHGDALVFPAGAARPQNTNNIPGLRLSSITFEGSGDGFILRGNGVTLSNGITVIAKTINTLRLDSIAMAKAQTIHVAPDGLLTVFSDVTLNSADLSLATIGDLTIRGAVNGRGNLSKSGAGQLSLSGTENNTFVGSLTIASGSLAMNKSETTSLVPLVQVSRIAVPGNLTLGNGSGTVVATAHFDNQIAKTATVTVRENATLNFNDHDSTLSELVFQGGAVHTGKGAMTLLGDLTADSSAVTAILSGNLLLAGNGSIEIAPSAAGVGLDLTADVGGIGLAGLTKTGTGSLRLGGANTYLGHTLVNAGTLRIGHESALGATSSGTTATNVGGLFIEHTVHLLREPLTLARTGGGTSTGVLRVVADVTIATNVFLTGPTLIRTIGDGYLTIDGVISGTGPLRHRGEGTLQLAGHSANTFTGDLHAEEGVLLLSKLAGSAVQGDLIIGTTNTSATARHTRSANLGGAVTVNAGSLYDLNDNNESIDALTLNGGGDVQTGSGQLTLDGDVLVSVHPGEVLAASHIRGRLHVGTEQRHFIVEDQFNGEGGLEGVDDLNELVIDARVAGSADLIKRGPGDLILTASNTFTGTLTVQDGALSITDGHGLGATSGQTVVSGNASLIVFGSYDVENNGTGIVVDEPLFLNTTGQANGSALFSFGSNVLSGSIFLAQNSSVNVFSNHVLHLAGVINGIAGLTKIGPGTLIYSGMASNTYLGATRVNEGTLRLARTTPNGSIPGPLIIGDTMGAPLYDGVEAVGPVAQINTHSHVVVNPWGKLSIELPGTKQRIATLSGSGEVELIHASLVLDSSESAVFDGFISGSGSLEKRGNSEVTLNGLNTYTGDTEVQEGTLVINGTHPSSDVIVSPSGTLRGVGHVNALSVAGTLQPGDPLGRLEAQTVNFLPGSTMVTRLEAPPAVGPFMPNGHSSFRSLGVADVTGAKLQLALGFPPSAGQAFILGGNLSDFPTTGNFLGMPEGAVLIRNEIPLLLSYVGGNGNDITLTVGALPLRLDAARVEAGNGNGRIEPDECNDIQISIENPTGAAVTVATAYLRSLDNRVIVTQGTSDYDVVPASSSRTNRTRFQIRTTPELSCGENVEFHLVVETVGKGTFAIPVTLPTGVPGSLREFASPGGPTFIPDGGTLDSQLQVSTPFKVAKARVSLHVTHPSVGQLRLKLISPSGREVLLADAEGGAGNNYGQSCERRTLFDDNAPLSITTAEAPFSSRFAPEGKLSDFIGEHSAGLWTLRIEDRVAGGIGALQCWTLELAPAECASPTGGCVSCLATVEGTLNDSGPTMPDYLKGGYPSSCGETQDCLGTAHVWHPPYRYGTHSFTNAGPETCVAVALTVPCDEPGSRLFASAYLGSFNSAQLCANLLGHSGESIGMGTGGFSFRVPAGEIFTVVVNEQNIYKAFNGCDSYSLQIYGLPCPQEEPRIHIANDSDADSVRLHWSTAYPGFQLQGKPNLGGNGVLSVFTNVPTLPVVVDGHYSVTNSHDRKTDGFFRLRKP